ncbi:MAG: glycine betaine ABC transporter substrate-binding protein [Bacteroidota bacterium]
MKRILFLSLLLVPLMATSQSIRVGAKHFNEGYILSEIISQLLEQNGYEVKRVYNLGGTLVCFEALRTGAIDIYRNTREQSHPKSFHQKKRSQTRKLSASFFPVTTLKCRALWIQ